MLVHGKEVVAAQVGVAIGVPVSMLAASMEKVSDECRGLRLVELDRAAEVGEAAADLRHEVADLEGDLGVRLVDRERAGGSGGGGGGVHLIPR